MLNMDCADQLSDREIEVLQLLADGLNNKKIADNLDITLRTVKFHTANIYKKIGVSSRSAAIVWVWKNKKFPLVS